MSPQALMSEVEKLQRNVDLDEYPDQQHRYDRP
jgi:hypothetical protein